MSAAVIQGNDDQVNGHIISTIIGGKNGEPKRVNTEVSFIYDMLVCSTLFVESM